MHAHEFIMGYLHTYISIYIYIQFTINLSSVSSTQCLHKKVSYLYIYIITKFVTKYKNDNEYELYCMLINTILWRLNELVAGPTRHVTSSSQTAMTRQVFILVLMT